ncbi:ubiquinol-cytochrome-c reductase complex assembly factor 1 isoform X2 [Photinus pyralis]|nr:ubiquinol-cytochrome-c reductase complex assembly factor 1 isoform X2 [Photinus pyralis]XP_031353418.1 ubiquinol-cytochrome-c reductase complex assembly factor 1 isoform X2 [Photinus pyralis]XP_031353419.1 ubiquinol-cytochrome-c reductase complex assembly factor 1 isoform X2 [Photinus pyralis]
MTRPQYLCRPVSTTDTQRSYNFKTLTANIANKFSLSKSRSRVLAYLLFESIVDHIDYAEIFKTLKLPDTFYSWFVVTELYLWMLMVRFMAEGEDGECLRNTILEVLWADVDQRVKKLGEARLSTVRAQIIELSDQLRAAIIAYDEGLQTSDVVLAGALWRRLYQQGTVDPECLDVLVKYIRRQVKLLDNTAHEEFKKNKTVKWEPIQ